MSRASENRIRIKDIAERAKVSAGTVDRVLHNRGEVAESTRRQIMKIVEELGYTPNLLAKSLASKKLYRIAVLIPDSKNDNPYWAMPMRGIQQAQNEFKDFNTTVEIFTFDINREDSFSRSYRKILKTEPDGFVFTPLFYGKSLECVDACEAAGIPFVFVDVQLESCANLAYYGQDAVQSGLLAARLVHYSLPEDSGVLLLKLASRGGVTHHLKRRERGFQQFFDSDDNTKRIQNRSLELHLSDDEILFDVFDKTTRDMPALKGIFVTNSKVYKVAEWLKLRQKKDLLLIGYDLIERNIEYLEDGTIDFLIGQKPEEQGYKSIQAMFNYLISNRSGQKVNYSSIDIIMKENIDYYRNFSV